LPAPAAARLVPDGPAAPAPGQADTGATATPDLSAEASAPYVAVGTASGDTSLPIQVLVLPGADASGDSLDGGATPVPVADTAAAVKLAVSVDDTGNGNFEAVPLSLTEYQPAVLPATPGASPAGATDAGSPASPAGPAVPLSAPGTPAADPAKRDSGSDLGSSRSAGSADPTPLTTAAAADPVTSPSFVPLPELTGRAEDLPGLQALESGLPAPVVPLGPEGLRWAPAPSDGEKAATVPPGPAAPAAGGLWVGPEGTALSADVALWSRIGRDALLGDDTALQRLDRSDALPAATNEVSGTRSTLLRVGQILAQAFYLQRLRSAAGAAPDAAGLAQAAADTRLGAAEAVQEAATEFVRLVRGFYERFLGRPAVNGEESGWVSMLLGGQTEEQVLSAFLSTEEFGRRAAEMAASVTPDEAFIAGLYALLLLRVAADEELTGWLTALPTLGRRGVALALLRSVEYRRRQVESFYRELLQRDGDAEEIAGWAATPFDLQKVRGYFLSRPDLFANS
jgi:hypothetical protein